MRELLRRKIGPFPAWAWAGFVFLLVVVMILRRRKAARAAAAAASSTDTQEGDTGPSDAAGGSLSNPMIPASSPGAPAGGVLPIDLVVTFQDAATKATTPAKKKHAATIAKPKKINARRGVPKKVRKPYLTLPTPTTKITPPPRRRRAVASTASSHATGGSLPSTNYQLARNNL